MIRSSRTFSQKVLDRRCKSSVAADRTGARTQRKSTPVAQSLAAAAAGIATVSAVAAICEATAKVPSFDPKGQRFSQETFGGRFARMLLACDPRLLLYTQEQVNQAKQLCLNYEEYGPEMDRALWEARRVYESALHPDTGDVIPRPFRMSGYVPYNGPICVAMVAAQSTTPLLFWSWVNQSQNAMVNYYNRNASSPMTNETLAMSYGAAVGSALIVAFGLATAIQRRFPADKAQQLLRWVAFPSAVVASSLNCYIVRSPECTTGIPLLNENGEEVLEGETSCEAARRGVYSTTASRALLQAPVYFVPPALLAAGAFKSVLAKNPRLSVPITTYLLLVSFGVGLPATVAIFPQMAEIPASKVEPKYQHLRDPSTGEPYKVYYYNKGM